MRTLFLLISLNLAIWPAMFSQDHLSRYRIQVKALQRTKLDSLKVVSDSIAAALQMDAYIIDQDNYYKILVGDFEGFGQASAALDLVKEHYKDAWITFSFHDQVVYPEPIQYEEAPESTDYQLIVELEEAEPDEPPLAPDLSEMEIAETPEADTLTDIKPEVDTITAQEVFLPEEILPVKRRRLFPRIYGGGTYLDLHAANPEMYFCTYLGYGMGLGFSYALSKNFLLDLSADYNLTSAVALYEKHELSGNSDVLRISGGTLISTDIYKSFAVYGRIGIGYFNYDYSYSLELKPGYSGGPASVETELLERAWTYGLDVGIGVRLFRNLDISFITYYDLNERRYHALHLGIVF